MMMSKLPVNSTGGRPRSQQRPHTPCVIWCIVLIACACAPVIAGSEDIAAASDNGVSDAVLADWLARDAAFSVQKSSRSDGQRNARGVTTRQDASGGCDGIRNGRWGFHTASKEQDPWWQVDLGEPCKLDRVVIYNRTDSGCASRTKNIRLLTALDNKKFKEVYQHNGEVFYGEKKGKPLVIDLRAGNISARFVRLHVPGRCSFALDEVEVYPADSREKNIALGKPADQKSVGPYSYPGTLGTPPNKTADGGFSIVHTREVLERASGLVDRLRHDAAPKRLKPLVNKLTKLTARTSAIRDDAGVKRPARRKLYLEACGLARKIAFCNPLLDFNKLLFVKRHDAGGPFHMCDQYYGCNAIPGGGLFILEDPFSSKPELKNVLADAVVENGRLKGQKLEGGSFLSPELSYDGKTILFAYTQAKAKKTYQWSPEFSYHIFKVNTDGTGLVQLTDGPCNDFDPCFLPDGRIVFISERRGGYLRCGRHCPVYTMFSMKPDGSDMICISFHETHEWHPSVDNNGMIVYTRWDYVDRDTNVAHHIWLCYPDGRNPRSLHGNYPVKRQSRPWMEMSIRAIPGSHKYVATTGAHHGHAFGSLVLIDHRIKDDRAMSQIERLTPEVPFPETNGHIRQYSVYGTPWPLSEDDYLCVRDRNAKNYAIYWIDRDGDKELLYRDTSISCVSPIPLRPRPAPPIIPDGTTQTNRSNDARPATIGVVDIYDADFRWPPDTKITKLRIIQLLPKSTAPPNKPRIGVANQTNARAVLGTVPVEADGSVYFEAPVGMPIYFQALDENEMAVQSMRSVTYVHPGEQLMCKGCHEPKRRAAGGPNSTPIAMTRPPSEIRPDVEASNPFNYPRLVQPVLDRNCVKCHREEDAIDLSGKLAKNGFSRSYSNLAGEYGFYFHVSNGSIKTGVHGGSRTIPGKFGAKASALMNFIGEDHYGVKLSDEDFHRITLWLDCNSEFLGAYEDAPAQARGEVVQPSLE